MAMGGMIFAYDMEEFFDLCMIRAYPVPIHTRE
jgi:hypothetical protein